MHDTAFHIGTLAMNIYSDLRTDSILEVGSRAVNGSLRESSLPSTRYIGVDIEEGDGVDLVIAAGDPLPVDDNSFELVMATSVFEHDPCFWMTFLEMCRATKDGGYVYLNAPSNGVVHRHPQDNWRFYPDSGKALAQWSASQGQPVLLVESFVAKRDKDIWNDFVAVFRKGPIKKALPKVFLHEHVECTDVVTWKSKEIINPSDQTEDLILLTKADERARLAEDERARAEGERATIAEQAAELKARLTGADDERQRQIAEIGKMRGEVSLRESELRQRQEEIQQTRSELTRVRSEIDSVRAELSASERRLKAEAASRKESEAELAKVRSRLDFVTAELSAAEERLELALSRAQETEERLELALTQMQETERELEQALTRNLVSETELEHSRAERSAAEAKLQQRFQEIASLTSLLVQAEASGRRSREHMDWLCETGSILVNGSDTLKGRLMALLPAALQHRRYQRLLKRRGLFDGDAYLAAHPDVQADGADPLRHYLKHGISENRRRG